MRELLLVAIFVACPLMMFFMMRGGHDQGHGAHETKSTSALRRKRKELDRLIEERESEEETPTPAGGASR